MYALIFFITGIFKYFARVEGVEPSTNGFGDRYSTN